ncbi:hypothetical protein, partial [Endozoicomonas acroporae]|uniref:hypothetical protein n=1 Tax=Endozoicomonas acroporae TaxID=1701104 RepID=UPI0019D4F94E
YGGCFIDPKLSGIYCYASVFWSSLIVMAYQREIFLLTTLVVESENPQEKLKKLTESLEDYRPLRISSKHMAGRELGRMMPTASLKYRLPEYQTLVH